VCVNNGDASNQDNVMEGYLRQVWDMSEWLYEGQRRFRLGYPCERQIVTVFQDVADSLDEGARIDAIVIDFSKAVYLVPYNRMPTKIAASRMDSSVVVLVREFL
jgi:hypothetical protein